MFFVLTYLPVLNFRYPLKLVCVLLIGLIFIITHLSIYIAFACFPPLAGGAKSMYRFRGGEKHYAKSYGFTNNSIYVIIYLSIILTLCCAGEFYIIMQEKCVIGRREQEYCYCVISVISDYIILSPLMKLFFRDNYISFCGMFVRSCIYNFSLLYKLFGLSFSEDRI